MFTGEIWKIEMLQTLILDRRVYNVTPRGLDPGAYLILYIIAVRISAVVYKVYVIES